MPRGKSSIINLKPYDQTQLLLLPPSFEEMIPEKHLVRVVNTMIDDLDLQIFLKSYKGGGTSVFHPKMMIKVIVYAYLNKIYTSRKIAKALREDIHFMWLSGMQRPDFRTINEFRSTRLKDIIDTVFAAQVEYLIENGYIRLDNYFVDGSKIEANANKYSHVWRKNVERYETATKKKIRDLISHIEKVNNTEQENYGNNDLEELGEGFVTDSEKLKKYIDTLKDQLSKKKQAGSFGAAEKETAKAVRNLEKEQLPKLEKYEQNRKDLGGRNSFSKTDKDATFVRMKDGLLRPGYNVLIGCEKQFLINYSIHQNPGESGLFIPHMAKLNQLVGRLPKNAIADSAFGSFENYEYLSAKGIGNYLKYNTFAQDLSSKTQSEKFSKHDFKYDESNDSLVCPKNEVLKPTRTRTRISNNGYPQEVKIYECEQSADCPMSNKCILNRYKKLEYNRKLEVYKAAVYQSLTSYKGVNLRKQRCIEPETIFGDIKWNQKFTRFTLRGSEKVNIEMGILSLVHNFKKLFTC